jgi:hypothetical protein
VRTPRLEARTRTPGASLTENPNALSFLAGHNDFATMCSVTDLDRHGIRVDDEVEPIGLEFVV